MANFLKKWFSRSSQHHPYCTAIVAAAGSSSRMGGEDKLFMLLCGVPVLARTLCALERAECVDEIVIAVREESLVRVADLCKAYTIQKPVKVVVGGATRAQSVLCAALEASPGSELLAVQDGARALVTPELIDRVVNKAAQTYAAAPAIPVKDTLKIARDGVVCSTPLRSELFAVQTPQVFDASLLKGALQSALDKNVEITDDCSAVEFLGKEIYLTEGSEENIKITTPLDVVFAEAILQRRDSL